MNHATIRELQISQVEAYRSSDKPAKVWCEENQLNLHTLKYWIRKLNRQAKDSTSPNGCV
ncbi:IS66 family insertion sequence element accessory protein TnpA [Anoxynatronum buryatiense]|uniref:IS66 family insertion sequence element accessory protein TnpA n=1 Tax=Anoxynatronum buryatiense TaxID=489973 RepID=UPI003D2CA7AF